MWNYVIVVFLIPELILCPPLGSADGYEACDTTAEAAAGIDGQNCMVVVRCEEISKCFVLPVYTTSCDELRLVVEAAFEKLVPASSLRRLRLLIDGREVPDGNQKLSEAGLGLGKAAVDVILLERIDCGGGDLKCQFKSIIVEQLPSLIEAIKVDFEGWREKIRLETGNYPVY